MKNKSRVFTTFSFSSRFLTNSLTFSTFCSSEFRATKFIPVTSFSLNWTLTSSSPGSLATRVSVTFFLSSTDGVLGCSVGDSWGFSALGFSGVTWGFSSGLGCSEGVVCGFSSTLGC